MPITLPRECDNSSPGAEALDMGLNPVVEAL